MCQELNALYILVLNPITKSVMHVLLLSQDCPWGNWGITAASVVQGGAGEGGRDVIGWCCPGPEPTIRPLCWNTHLMYSMFPWFYKWVPPKTIENVTLTTSLTAEVETMGCTTFSTICNQNTREEDGALVHDNEHSSSYSRISSVPVGITSYSSAMHMREAVLSSF